MKPSTTHALIGLAWGLLFFLAYILLLGCYVEKVNIYNAPADDNRTSQLIKPAEKEEGKKGIGLDQS